MSHAPSTKDNYQSAPRSRRLVMFRLVAVSAGILIGLVAAEAGLRVAEKIRLGDRAAPATERDPTLGSKLTPNTPGHDGNGFRNATIRPHVEVVALGDSQTWGVNVQSYDAWPQQLEKDSGRSVYNMGVGGYGPVQYWMLTEKALTFSPKVIVVGLYFGNDIYDAYALTYSNDKYTELRAAEAGDLQNDTVGPRSQSYWDEEKNFHNGYGRSSVSGWGFWLREHSAIGRLLNRAGLWPGATDVDYEIDKAWAQAHPDHGAVCEDTRIRTVFTTAYRLCGLDLDEVRITQGLRITKEALWKTQQKTEAQGVKLVVLLIPTKESVYADLMQQEGKYNGTYRRLVDNESRARKEIVQWCEAKHISYLDALPDLRAAITRRQQIYPSTTESHPNVAGYRILADVVNKSLN